MKRTRLGGKNLHLDAQRLKVLLGGGGGGGGGIGYIFVPCLGGNEGGDITSRRTWMDDDVNRGVEINSSGDQVSGATMLPNGVTSVEVYPLLRATGATDLTIYFEAETQLYLSSDSYSDYVNPSLSLSSGYNWLTDQSVTLTADPGTLLHCYIQAEGTPTNSKKVYVYGWVAILG